MMLIDYLKLLERVTWMSILKIWYLV